MIIQWRKFIFTINEIYEDNRQNVHLKKAAIHAYFQQPRPVETHRRFSIHRKSLHLCIDLKKSEKELLKEMSRKTRYKVNRAKRSDNVTIKYIEYPELNDIEAFAQFYNSFARAKGIATCKIEKLISLMENNMLVIMSVYHADGRILVSNAMIANKGTAIGLYSASARFFYRNVTGQFVSRANRYLHWCGITYFKQLGYHTFDLMGLKMNVTNKDYQKVNEFKRSFGGNEIIQYQSFIPQNLLGTLCVWMLKFLWRNNLEVLENKQMPVKEYPESEKN